MGVQDLEQMRLVGADEERERIIKCLNDYFELTKYSEQTEGAEPNPEWSLGFQAAVALIKGEK